MLSKNQNVQIQYMSLYINNNNYNAMYQGKIHSNNMNFFLLPCKTERTNTQVTQK